MKFNLVLHKIQQQKNDIWSLAFEKPQGFDYQPGQFLETEISHHAPDDRGTNRWFTLSSAPTEKYLTITTRYIEEQSSTYKKALFGLKAGDTIKAEGPMGQFLLPTNQAIKLIWIAGGVGITPFLSQLRHLVDSQDLDRNITLYYAVRDTQDVIYTELLSKAIQKLPNFRLFIVSPQHKSQDNQFSVISGRISSTMLKKHTPDILKSEIFISGPGPMVDSLKEQIISSGAQENKIHEDWFPGYQDEFIKTH